MPRRSREDGPDTLHHVYNRGIARRTVFEMRPDVRFFESRLARVHRKGILETHGFCFLSNHFHLIVRSPTGQLPTAMQQTINPFVRWFNRKRKRDGALFRGRFGSRRIQSTAYLTRLVRYVDQNSVEARLVSHSELYPYGSARFFLEGRSPKWHQRGLIEELACQLTGAREFTPDVYRESFGTPLTRAESEWMEMRMRCPRDGPDPLDDLVGAAPERVRDWMVRKAKLADGSLPGLPLTTPSVLLGALSAVQAEDPDFRVHLRGRSRSAWPLLGMGLLREECALSHAAAARTLNRPVSSVATAVAAHRELMVTDPVYATLAATILSQALDEMHGFATTRLPEGAKWLR
jgi:REP element-mobilizing transposase RayT